MGNNTIISERKAGRKLKQTEWILCPVWGSETRIRIREDTAARTRRLKTDFAEQKAEEQGYKEIVIWAFFLL
ncbi:hypothetical protein D5282_14255 [bacterium 1xD8-48]|nr:hypothetical protein [bacterium 1xD8-48]